MQWLTPLQLRHRVISWNSTLHGLGSMYAVHWLMAKKVIREEADPKLQLGRYFIWFNFVSSAGSKAQAMVISITAALGLSDISTGLTLSAMLPLIVIATLTQLVKFMASPFGGSLADRMSRRRIIVRMDWLQTGLSLMLFLMIALGLFDRLNDIGRAVLCGGFTILSWGVYSASLPAKEATVQELAEWMFTMSTRFAKRIKSRVYPEAIQKQFLELHSKLTDAEQAQVGQFVQEAIDAIFRTRDLTIPEQEVGVEAPLDQQVTRHVLKVVRQLAKAEMIARRIASFDLANVLTAFAVAGLLLRYQWILPYFVLFNALSYYPQIWLMGYTEKRKLLPNTIEKKKGKIKQKGVLWQRMRAHLKGEKEAQMALAVGMIFYIFLNNGDLFRPVIAAYLFGDVGLYSALAGAQATGWLAYSLLRRFGTKVPPPGESSPKLLKACYQQRYPFALLAVALLGIVYGLGLSFELSLIAQGLMILPGRFLTQAVLAKVTAHVPNEIQGRVNGDLSATLTIGSLLALIIAVPLLLLDVRLAIPGLDILVAVLTVALLLIRPFTDKRSQTQ